MDWNLLQNLQNNKLFVDIDVSEIDFSSVEKNVRMFKEGEIVYAKSDESKSFYLILEGSVNVIDYNFLNRGERKSGAQVLNENDFFGYEDLAKNIARTSTAFTLSDTALLELTKDNLNALAAENVKILNNLKRTFMNAENKQKPASPKQKPEKLTSVDSSTMIDGKLYDFRQRVDKPVVEAPQKSDYPFAKQTVEYDEEREALEREKALAEKALEKEIEELSKKEEELARGHSSLEKEKAFAEESIAEELEEISRREKKLKEIELAFEKKEENAKEKLAEEIKSLENTKKDLEQKSKEIAKDKQLINQAMEKAKKVAQQELDVMKKNQELMRQKKRVEEIIQKESSLKAKEVELSNLLEEVKKEKEIARQTIAKQKEVEKKEKELTERIKSLQEEKQNVNKSLEKEDVLAKKEKEIELKEKELAEKYHQLHNEKKSIEQAHLKEKELEERIKDYENKAKFLEREKNFSSTSLSEQVSELTKREEEFAQKERALKKEKEFSEMALQAELEDLQKKEEEFKKSLTESLSNHYKELSEREKSFDKRESELLEKIRILEDEKNRMAMLNESLDHKASELSKQMNNLKSSLKYQSNSPIKSDDAKVKELLIFRDPNTIFQTFNHQDIAIMLVNLTRGTVNFAADFNTSISEMLKKGKRKIIIDFTHTEFLDSTFLGALVSNLKKLSKEGGELKVVLDLKKITSTTFLLSGMDRVFKLYESISEAINDFLLVD
ncbi:MAG: cyclic nucleotide-binding domain-containing protein [Bacteroidetes bacterium]|nr:cyclic nucleotide-binding domain-containing protein [Bacteroidota bacterium]